MLIEKEELKKINGGATSITSSIINAFVKGIDEIIKAGEMCGSAIRRIFEGAVCDLD